MDDKTAINRKIALYKGRIVTTRNILFFVGLVVVFLLVYFPLNKLLSGANDEYYDYILVIPFISAYLIYMKHNLIFENIRYDFRLGIPLIIVAVGIYACFGTLLSHISYVHTMLVSAAILLFIGTYICIYGIQSYNSARFPLLFLAFMIPIPQFILNGFIYSLQVSSTEATDFLFNLTGVPYYREGFLFHLPGVTIEVARECSGIRSSLAMIVTGVVAGHLFLDRSWKKTILILSIFPITVFKNGIRIVTLTLLAVYVDIRFLTQSFLHHSGGFLFYIPGLVLLGLEIWLMRRSPK